MTCIVEGDSSLFDDLVWKHNMCLMTAQKHRDSHDEYWVKMKHI